MSLVTTFQSKNTQLLHRQTFKNLSSLYNLLIQAFNSCYSLCTTVTRSHNFFFFKIKATAALFAFFLTVIRFSVCLQVHVNKDSEFSSSQ